MIGVRDMMRRTGKNCIVAIFVAVLFGLASCGDQAPPAPSKQVVKKKIGEQKSETDQKVIAAKAEPKVSEEAAPTESSVEGKTEDAEISKLVKESMEATGGYDSKGRFDPFEPLLKDDPQQGITTAKSRKKRVPQTPLERVAISQLKLSAIMRSSKGNSAIVEDASGKGYVVRKGTYVGLNSGQVTRISKSSVMIEEEIEDVSGEFRVQNIELKLQKPAGEL